VQLRTDCLCDPAETEEHELARPPLLTLLVLPVLQRLFPKLSRFAKVDQQLPSSSSERTQAQLTTAL
jgi:hypothetical protein